MTRTFVAVVIVALLLPTAHAVAQESSSAFEITPADHSRTLEHAQRAFYNARYAAAAAVTAEPCSAGAGGLAACELRTAALLFQIKRALGKPADREKAWKQCVVCPELMSAFEAALARGQALARARLQTHPEDRATLFLLGKLDLNYVWLQLGTLGRKTGWSEYWEARRALDKVLKFHPDHVRARVARGWIDYIVDTKMPRGTRWLLGGGNRQRGLLAVRQAADAEADFFTRAEARFALWDMQIRERDLQQAVVTARALSRDFPDNEELNTFIEAHDPSLPHQPHSGQRGALLVERVGGAAGPGTLLFCCGLSVRFHTSIPRFTSRRRSASRNSFIVRSRRARRSSPSSRAMPITILRRLR